MLRTCVRAYWALRLWGEVQRIIFTLTREYLTFTTLWAFLADGKLMIFFLFFLENRIWHFMQIVSSGDNLHEMSNPVFWEE